MSKSKKNPVVNSRNEGSKVFGHGGQDPKSLGPTKGNDRGPKRTQVNLRPANADKDFEAGQHGEEK